MPRTLAATAQTQRWMVTTASVESQTKRGLGFCSRKRASITARPITCRAFRGKVTKESEQQNLSSVQTGPPEVVLDHPSSGLRLPRVGASPASLFFTLLAPSRSEL